MLKLKLNKSLVPYKFFYFMLEGAHAILIPYMPTFAKQLGLTVHEVAVIYGLYPLLIIIFNPLIGAFADVRQNHKLVLLILLLVEIAFILPLYFLPEVKLPQDITFYCNDSSLYVNPLEQWTFDCNDNQNYTFSTLCYFSCSIQNQKSNEIYLKNSSENQEIFKLINFNVSWHHSEMDKITPFQLLATQESSLTNCSADVKGSCQWIKCTKFNNCVFRSKAENNKSFLNFQFWILFFFVLIGESANEAAVALGDAITMEKIRDDPGMYGRQRLFGAIGYGLLCTLFGFINDEYSNDKYHIDYAISFFSFAGVMSLLFCAVSIWMKVTIPPKSHKFFKDIKTIIKIPHFTIFSIILCINGMFHGFIFTYLFWYMQELGASQLNLGLSVLLETIGEIPIFFFSGLIIKVIGHAYTICVVLLAVALRCVGYTLFSNTWFFLPVGLLHGITFGLFFANMASYAKRISPPGTMATTQEFFSASFNGLGYSFGSLLGGLSYKEFGIVITLRGCAIVATLTCVIYIVITKCLQRMGFEDQQKIIIDKRYEENDKLKLDNLLPKIENDNGIL